jgi:hypothetical protein
LLCTCCFNSSPSPPSASSWSARNISFRIFLEARMDSRTRAWQDTCCLGDA